MRPAPLEAVGPDPDIDGDADLRLAHDLVDLVDPGGMTEAELEACWTLIKYLRRGRQAPPAFANAAETRPARPDRSPAPHRR